MKDKIMEILIRIRKMLEEIEQVLGDLEYFLEFEDEPHIMM